MDADDYDLVAEVYRESVNRCIERGDMKTAAEYAKLVETFETKAALVRDYKKN